MFPVRINRYLAQKGYATRRGADELIQKRKVFINGRIAELGDQVQESDLVEVRAGKKPAQYIYVAYNKPRGIITHSPAPHERDIRQSLDEFAKEHNLFPVGRLDKDSSGLIILTNDGRITDRLLNPDAEHDKEYVVKTKFPLRDSFRKHMEAGVDIEGYMTKPARVKILGDQSFAITIREGKKHQIRRMVVALHNEVVELRRDRILNIKLGTLHIGAYRVLEGEELATFLESLGL